MEKGKKHKTGVFLEPFEVISPLPKGIRFHVESKWWNDRILMVANGFDGA